MGDCATISDVGGSWAGCALDQEVLSARVYPISLNCILEKRKGEGDVLPGKFDVLEAEVTGCETLQLK